MLFTWVVLSGFEGRWGLRVIKNVKREAECVFFINFAGKL